MKYDIYISDLKRTKVLQFPVIPEKMPSFSKSAKNEEFETFSNGTFNIIGDVGLTEFTFESFLPKKGVNYSFQRVKNVNPYTYIDFINLSLKAKKPIRLIIVRSDKTYVTNDKYSIESFDYTENKIGNFEFSVKFKQWRDYNV